MNKKEQIISIAEACGWTNVKYHPQDLDGDEIIEGINKFGSGMEVPDYLNDLNAMHEAEKMISPTEEERQSCYGKWTEYGKNLCELLGYSEHERIWFGWVIYTANASQRAEAFLKTIGKWKENQNE